MSSLYPDGLKLPYKEIIGMRIILTHMYHKVEADYLRNTIKHSLPELQKIIDEYKATQL